MDCFKKMKDTAYLINCARGGIVVEEDLLEALDMGIIAGASLDCFVGEPQPKKELIRHPPCKCNASYRCHYKGGSGEDWPRNCKYLS